MREQAPQQGWTLAQLVAQISLHCGHSRLRAERLARGWTLDQLADEVAPLTAHGQRVSPSRICRWELHQDRPSPPYLEALCRVYRTGPVELGFGHDYGPAAAKPGGVGSGQPAPAPEMVPDHSADRDAATSPTSAVARPGRARLVAQAGTLRQAMDETLSGSSLSDATVAHKEKVAEQYGRIYKTQPVQVFLRNILADFNEVQGLTDRRLPSGQRRDLCGVIARMAGLVSMTMVNLGEYREAREWGHTARLAADEATEPTLRAWVATRTAVAHLHFGDPAAAAAAAHEAELLTRHRPTRITAMACSIVARAAGSERDPKTARQALRRAEDLFDSEPDPADNSAYNFQAGQLHFYASHAFTGIGETAAARRAQDAALAAFGPEEMLDPTLVHLDRALCMIQDGETDAGTRYATDVLLGLPDDYRPAIVVRRARAVAMAVPPRHRSMATVRTFHDALALGGPGADPDDLAADRS